MAVNPTYPGVYIDEVPSGVRTIIGVSTSMTAFVGRTRKGPVRTPTIVHSFGDFVRNYGDLWADSPMTYAVQQYFANGGADAVIVRAFNGNAANSTARFTFAPVAPDPGSLQLVASGPGLWADTMRVTIDHVTSDPPNNALFNISVRDTSSPAPLETLRNVSLSSVTTVLEQQSAYLRVDPAGTIPASVNAAVDQTPTAASAADGSALVEGDLLGVEASRSGIYALLDTDIFNLLCLPPPAPGVPVTSVTFDPAATFCKKHRAMLIVDAPDDTVANVKTSGPALVTGDGKANAALFYPRVRMFDPATNNTILRDYVPCGAVAGVFARTDADRGVWKAPAGIDSGIAGVQALTRSLTDDDNGDLNPLGINCLRNFPLIGPVVWGSRTMLGGDAFASEWKYVPVRRMALYLEESLYRGLKWVVFEPNAAPLWSQIRLNVGAFLQNLFRQGAFQGTSPRDAYFVRCDSDTTTQTDINSGIVNVLVGFAPLRPAEFVIIKIQQMAGETPT